MNQKKYNIVVAMLLVMSILCLSGCGKTNASKDEGDKTISIAFQYGLAYAPVTIVKEQQLLEKTYKEKTGRNLTVNWVQMNSGPDINTGIASGEISAGFMGVGPAITGVMKGVGYKVFTNLSGQAHGLMTNDSSINSLSDIVGTEKQIALVNIGSIQHIMLAMALDKEGLDPHALDSNIVAMKHPDGMSSVQSGSIACHLTSNPYIFKEREDSTLHEIEGVNNVWNENNSFIVGVASENLHNDDIELYNCLCDAFNSAVDMINGNIDEAAKLACEFDGNTVEDEKKYMSLGKYMVETNGLFEFASFMAENGFIDKAPASYGDLVFDNVKGN